MPIRMSGPRRLTRWRLGALFASTALVVPAAALKPVAQITSVELREISGCAVARRMPSTMWVHNDSGDRPMLYAVDTRNGSLMGGVLVVGAEAVDWEDMAWGPGPGNTGWLYVGDIGDNTVRRTEVVVYRVAEPSRDDLRRGSVEASATLRLRFPDGPRDAEAMAVDPLSGDLYVIAKEAVNGAGVYSLRDGSDRSSGTYDLVRVGTITVDTEGFLFPNRITAADISVHRQVVLRTYQRGLLLNPPTGSFDDIWSQRPREFALPAGLQSEAICFEPQGRSALTTSERLPAPIFRVAIPPAPTRAAATSPATTGPLTTAGPGPSGQSLSGQPSSGSGAG